MPSVYQAPSTIRSVATFKDEDGALSDPTVVRLKVLAPDGTQNTYVYLTDSEVTKASTGVYHGAILLNAGGQWEYQWESDGTPDAAHKRTIEVEAAIF